LDYSRRYNEKKSTKDESPEIFRDAELLFDKLEEKQKIYDTPPF